MNFSTYFQNEIQKKRIDALKKHGKKKEKARKQPMQKLSQSTPGPAYFNTGTYRHSNIAGASQGAGTSSQSFSMKG